MAPDQLVKYRRWLGCLPIAVASLSGAQAVEPEAPLPRDHPVVKRISAGDSQWIQEHIEEVRLYEDAMFGRSALHWAARENKSEIASLLLNHGFDPNKPGENGLTPLHDAARAGSAGVALVLLDACADLEAGFDGGVTPLMIAAGAENDDAFWFLLGSGADPTKISDWGFTALHGARLHADRVRVLIKRGCRVDVSTRKGSAGKTPLFMAASAASVLEEGDRLTSIRESIELLLQAGANPLHTTEFGVRPVDVLCDLDGSGVVGTRTHHEIQRMLLEAAGVDEDPCE